MSNSALSADPLAALRERLGADRARWTWLTWAEAIGWAGAMALGGFLLALAIDAVWPLPLVLRLAVWLALAALVWMGGTRLAKAWSESAASEEAVALAIERRTPGGLENRLINAVQLARDARPESAEWCAAVVEENVARLKGEPLAEAAPMRPAVIALSILAAVVATGLAFWSADPERASNSATRLLIPFAAIETGEPAIEPPTRAISLARLRARYLAPAYARQEPRVAETVSGELMGLAGSDVELTFDLDQPVDAVAMVVHEQGTTQSQKNLELSSASERSFSGKLQLASQSGYHLIVTPRGKPPQKLGPYSVRILPDRPPRMELTGWESGVELPLDGVAPLQIFADDDFGLAAVALFARRGEGSEGEKWTELAAWPVGGKQRLRESFSLAATKLNAAEGEKVEIILRAKDNLPQRTDWIDGPTLEIMLGDGASTLQREYDQILKAQLALGQLIQSQEELQTKSTAWLRRIEEPEEGVKWSDAAQLARLHEAIGAIAADSQKLRESAATVARQMPAASGNLRLGLGLLADSELVRSQRIAESIPARDELTAKQAALADLRITQERILRSLRAMSDDFAAYRIDWEVGHTIPYLQMLAARQAKLRDASQAAAKRDDAAELLPMSLRRQEKLNSLLDLMQPACEHVAERLKEEQPDLASAFAGVSQRVVETNWRKPFAASVAALRSVGQVANLSTKKENWTAAATAQQAATTQLSNLVADLQKAQHAAAAKLLAAIRERAKTDPIAQQELQRLVPGSPESFLKEGNGKPTLPELIRMSEIAAGKKKPSDDSLANTPPANLGPIDPSKLELAADSGVRQDPLTLRLGTNPEATIRFELPPGDERNKVTPFLQEKFDDLVGKLLEEADELGNQYDTLRLSTNQNNNDPGEIQKQGGRINSTGAVAATGNKKPPTTEGGGAARVGRQGARATGMVATDEGVDRRGRDKALDGQEEIADQPGSVKLAKSDDPQKDHSTGVGGKRVESDETHFSTHDAGRWKDDNLRRMDKPQAKHSIVERQGEPVDPKLAQQLRDLSSRQEQVIERLKAVKKELNRLYLPSDHLDQLAAKLSIQLDRLREQPEPELFRLQLQTLDRLRGALAVFRTPSSSFQPSLPRERGLRMRVVDEPAAPALPGYEEATARYYEKLSEP